MYLPVRPIQPLEPNLSEDLTLLRAPNVRLVIVRTPKTASIPWCALHNLECPWTIWAQDPAETGGEQHQHADKHSKKTRMTKSCANLNVLCRTTNARAVVCGGDRRFRAYSLPEKIQPRGTSSSYRILVSATRSRGVYAVCMLCCWPCLIWYMTERTNVRTHT